MRFVDLGYLVIDYANFADNDYLMHYYKEVKNFTHNCVYCPLMSVKEC